MAQDYPWSSCALHCALATDHPALLAADSPFPGQAGSTGWADFVNAALPEAEMKAIIKSPLLDDRQAL